MAISAEAVYPEEAPRGKSGAKIELRQLGKVFNDTAVLRGLDLSLEPGQFVAIIGRSGSGKSTLLRLIAGLERQTEGLAFIDGEPLSGISPGTTVMFQEARLLPWKKVIDNVGIGLRGDWRKRGSGKSVWKAAPRSGPPFCRAARSSGWPSPGRLSATPVCCCSTNLWARLMR